MTQEPEERRNRADDRGGPLHWLNRLVERNRGLFFLLMPTLTAFLGYFAALGFRLDTPEERFIGLAAADEQLATRVQEVDARHTYRLDSLRAAFVIHDANAYLVHQNIEDVMDGLAVFVCQSLNPQARALTRLQCARRLAGERLPLTTPRP